MASLATTAVTPWPATTVVSVKHAKMITARSVSPTAGSVRTPIVLVAWKTVQSAATQLVLRARQIARIVASGCATAV